MSKFTPRILWSGKRWDGEVIVTTTDDSSDDSEGAASNAIEVLVSFSSYHTSFNLIASMEPTEAGVDALHAKIEEFYTAKVAEHLQTLQGLGEIQCH